MTDLLDRAVKSALQDFFDAAPERSDTPLEPAHRSPRSPSRTTLIAAATVVVVGVGGLLAVRLGDNPAGSGAATTPESTEAANNTYTVVSGDYLANIAERHCVTMDEIANYNNWSDGASHPLFPEQVILIPPGGCVPDSNGQTADAPEATFDPFATEFPRVPTLFPVVPEQTDPEVLEPAGGFSQIPWDEPPSVEAMVGRVEDGVIVDAVNIWATRDPHEPSGTDPQIVQVLGQEGTIVDASGGPERPANSIVSWGDDPYFHASGVDPMAFLAAADPGAIAVQLFEGTGLLDQLEFGQLPAGYEVIVDSQPVNPGMVVASLSVNTSAQREGNTVEVGVRNPLAHLPTVGTVSRVDINGITGWLLDVPGFVVTWQVDDTTFASVGGSGTPEESLELARSIEWVEVGPWMAQYGVELPVFPPT